MEKVQAHWLVQRRSVRPPDAVWCADAGPATDIMERTGSCPIASVLPFAGRPLGVEPSLQASPIPAYLPVEVSDAVQGAIQYNNPTAATALLRWVQAHDVELIAIRHGQSAANAQGAVLSGQSETPLTATGREQAKAVAATLYQMLGGDGRLVEAATNPLKVPAIHAGPLSRAQDTAQATVSYFQTQVDRLVGEGLILPGMGEHLKSQLTIRTDPRLTELGFGDMEMHTIDDLRKLYPAFTQAYDAWSGDGIDYLHRFPHGESRIDVMARMSECFAELAERDAGRTVLVFSHGEAINAGMAALGQAQTAGAGNLHAGTPGITNGSPSRLSAYSAATIQELASLSPVREVGDRKDTSEPREILAAA